jgi:hypothetical protein
VSRKAEEKTKAPKQSPSNPFKLGNLGQQLSAQRKNILKKYSPSVSLKEK